MTLWLQSAGRMRQAENEVHILATSTQDGNTHVTFCRDKTYSQTILLLTFNTPEITEWNQIKRGVDVEPKTFFES